MVNAQQELIKIFPGGTVSKGKKEEVDGKPSMVFKANAPQIDGVQLEQLHALSMNFDKVLVKRSGLGLAIILTEFTNQNQ